MIEAVLKRGTLPDAARRSCVDCRECKAAVSWWCTSQAAIDERGTRLPGVIGCPHWVPCLTEEQMGAVERRLSDYVVVNP